MKIKKRTNLLLSYQKNIILNGTAYYQEDIKSQYQFMAKILKKLQRALVFPGVESGQRKICLMS